MTVITISREFGSQGRTIAEQVAERLGYHLVDQTKIGKVLIQYGFVEFQYEYDSVPGFWARFDERRSEMMGMLDRVIRAVARYGNVVILGRGSYAVLEGYADVLNVRVQAPLEVRAAQVMAQQNLDSLEKAAAIVRENDNMRATFIDSFYKIPWNEVEAFDLVINTDKIEPEIAVNWLVDVVESMNKRYTRVSGKRTSIAIQPDTVLDSVIVEVLEGQQVV
jgi:cytidylate kinase